MIHCNESVCHSSSQVLNLNVRCSNQKDGCQWVGELRHAVSHEREECGWAVVECSYQCGAHLPRRLMEKHEHDVCPQRPMDVKLETFMKKMEERHQREKKEMDSKMAEQKKEMRRKMAEQKKEMESKMANQKKEMERNMAEQKKEILSKMVERKEMVSKMAEQKRETLNKMVEHTKEMKKIESKMTEQDKMIQEMESKITRQNKEIFTIRDSQEKMKVSNNHSKEHTISNSAVKIFQ